jgi:hypothetical protein
MKTLPSPIFPVRADSQWPRRPPPGHFINHDDFQFDLGKKVEAYSLPRYNLGAAVLPSKAGNFANGHATDAQVGQGIPHFIQLEWFDDGFDFLHGPSAKTPKATMLRGRLETDKQR